MDRFFNINSPTIIGEIIDGEAVIMNLSSGFYYSTDHVGGLIWGCIENGRSYREMLDFLASTFPAVNGELVPAVDTFLQDLLQQQLILEAPEDRARREAPAAGENGFPTVSGKHGFAAPVLKSYSDMKDLLLLDPVHDVDEVGWPTPKPL
jgi:hypothetical protein